MLARAKSGHAHVDGRLFLAPSLGWSGRSQYRNAEHENHHQNARPGREEGATDGDARV
jgi:hypothetical protein